MIPHKSLAVISVAAFLGACASSVPRVDFYETDSPSLRRLQAMEPVSADEAADLAKLGDVEGLYCKKTYEDVSIRSPFAKLQAIDQVKLKAAVMGARYVSQPQCDASDKGDPANNCLATIVCTASAFKLMHD